MTLSLECLAYHLPTVLSIHMKKKAPQPTLPMKIILYEIKNLKVSDIEGIVIERFVFGTRYFNLYNPRSICKDHCERIHFQWLSDTFHWPKEDRWRNCYNASKSYKTINLVGTSQFSLQQVSTPEVAPVVVCNPVHENGKRKAMHSPGGERILKMKEDTSIMKVALEVENNRKQRVQEAK